MEVGVFLKNNKGQSAVEAVLLLAVIVSLTVLVAREFKENEIVAGLVSGPWKRLDGMIQNGVWEPADTGNEKHPGRLDRHISTKD